MPLFSSVSRRAAPLSRMKYFMCGGGIWRHRRRRRSRFYMNAAAATKRSGAGAIFYAESSPLVIVLFSRGAAIPCVLYFRILCEARMKALLNISLWRPAALPPVRLTRGYFSTSQPSTRKAGLTRYTFAGRGTNSVKRPDMTGAEVQKNGGRDRDWVALC